MFREGSVQQIPAPATNPAAAAPPPRAGCCPFCRESGGCLMLSGAFSPRHAPPFLPGCAGADARRQREVKMRVWAASGAAQLKAEVQLESEGAGWRKSPWGFSKIIQPVASWEQPGAEHVYLPCSSPCPGTDQAAGAGGAEELGWKAMSGEARLEPAHHPPPPLSLSWPVVLDLSIFSRSFVFPGNWASSTFPLTAPSSCSVLTYRIHALAAFHVPLSLS